MRYYKISEDALKDMLQDSIKLSYLESGGVDNWDWYCDSINEGVEDWLDEHHDLVNTWDDDDPRREDFYIDDIAQIEIDTVYKRYLIEEN